MPLNSAILRAEWRSETGVPSSVSIRCTKSSTLPAWWQEKQWKTRVARLTEQLGSSSGWKGHRILTWSPLPTGERP
jgi:hypothetical protein